MDIGELDGLGKDIVEEGINKAWKVIVGEDNYEGELWSILKMKREVNDKLVNERK